METLLYTRHCSQQSSEQNSPPPAPRSRGAGLDFVSFFFPILFTHREVFVLLERNIYIYIYTASQPGCVSFVNNSQAPGSLLTGPGSPLFCRVPNSQRSLGGYSFCPPYLQGCVLSTRLFLTSHTVKRCRDQSENLESRSCLLSNSNNVEFHFSGTTVFFQYNIHSLYKEDTLSKETLEIKRKLGIAIQLPFCLVLEDKWTDSEEGWKEVRCSVFGSWRKAVDQGGVGWSAVCCWLFSSVSEILLTEHTAGKTFSDRWRPSWSLVFSPFVVGNSVRRGKGAPTVHSPPPPGHFTAYPFLNPFLKQIWAHSLSTLVTKAAEKSRVALPLEVLLLLLSRFSRVWLCATPQTAAHQAPLSMGFSRQEHWSGLPFPSPVHELPLIQMECMNYPHSGDCFSASPPIFLGWPPTWPRFLFCQGPLQGPAFRDN